MQRPRRGDTARALALLAGAWAAQSCITRPTEVLVVLDTDALHDRSVTFTAFVAGTSGGVTDAAANWQRPADGGGIALPASFAIVPAAGESLGDEVTLTIRLSAAPGSHGEPAVQFDRFARFRFVPHSTITLRMFMAMACGAHADGCHRLPAAECTVAEICAESEMTCGERGECVAPDVVPTLDSGTRMDATSLPDQCVRACTGRVCGNDGCGGSCGACGGGMNCAGNGQCQCNAGLTDCGGGTCTDLSSSRNNCGACGTRCGTNEQCTGGACACIAGAMRVGGVCLESCGSVLQEAHLSNVGAGCCGSPCTGTEAARTYDCAHCCENTGPGACACAGGLSMCGGACVDAQTDPNHCGNCTTVCTTGSCAGGLCGCGGGQMRCGGVCTSVSSDVNNCGSCGSVCGAPGPGCCGGVCTSLNFDPNNCGSCGHTCSSHMCSTGTCI